MDCTENQENQYIGLDSGEPVILQSRFAEKPGLRYAYLNGILPRVMTSYRHDLGRKSLETPWNVRMDYAKPRKVWRRGEAYSSAGNKFCHEPN